MVDRSAGQGSWPLSPYDLNVTYGKPGAAGLGPDWFGPLEPITPLAPPEVAGRQWDYLSGYNLSTFPRGAAPISFATLRGLADGCDLLRLVIETRKDQVARLSWTISPRDKRASNDPRLAALRKFFSKPDGCHGFADWLRMILEDLFVIDAPTLYMSRDRGGRLLGLLPIDGATIKPVIDDWGRTPLPYVENGETITPVAYQQILKGYPAVDYSVRDLLYRPRNVRVDRAYGFGPVEQIVTTVNIALRRQAYLLDYFTQGNIPDSLIGVPESWTPDQIASYQKYWDAYFDGDLARRRRAKFVPGGVAKTFVQTREPDLKGPFDEWLARLICFAFGTSNTSQSYSYVGSPQVQIGTCSFNPNLTPVYNLGDDDFIATDGDDPVQVERSDPYAAHNMQTLEISQRTNYYDATPITAFDQNAIELYGLRIASTITAHEICDAAIAQTSAQLILQRGLYIRNHYTFKLSWEYCLLEPMDLVTLTDANLGLSNAVVRITEVEEADDGILTFTAEEFPAGIATAVAYPVQTQSSATIATNGSPGSINPPLIFEPPSALTGGSPQVWAAVTGGVPSAFKLAETAASGVHQCSMIMASQAAGTLVSFLVDVQAVERSACILEIFNGSATLACAFDLIAGTATPGSGVTSASIIAQTGGWYQLSMSCAMTAAATPVLTIGLESGGASNYAGTSGSGLYFWNASFAAGSEIGATLPAFTSVSGATIAVASVTTPLGQAGTANPNWGGAHIWVSLDGTSYTQIGSIAAGAKQGVLTAALPAPTTSNPDVANTLSVDLVESGGALSSTSATGAQNAATLAIVDNELISFETATLTSTDCYNLTTLYRGLYGTVPTSHASGAPFARLDTSIFEYDLPANYIGQTVYLKFQSFNIFGAGVQDLSACAVYSFTATGQGVSDPITAQLATRVALDLGLVTQSPAAVSGNLGGLVGAILDAIDLGTTS